MTRVLTWTGDVVVVDCAGGRVGVGEAGPPPVCQGELHPRSIMNMPPVSIIFVR